MRPVPLSEVIQESRSGFWGADPGSGDLDVRVVRNGDIQENGLRWESLPLRGVSHSEAERASLRKDDVLITTSGDCGYTAHIQSDPDEPTIASNFIRILRFDLARVIPRFLHHFLHSQAFRANLAPYIRGTALKNLSFATAAERITVPLPSLPEQRRIAEILDKADALRAKRRAALAQLETLTQSIFLDMFGDPATNPKGWPRTTLGALITVGPQNGLYKPSENYGTGTPILRIDAFYDGVVTKLASLKRVRLSAQEQDLYALREGEIVINRVNSREYLGKSAVIPALSETTVFESNMMRFDVDRELLEPGYLIHYLQTTFVRAHVDRSAKDAVNQSSINQRDVKATPLVVPPIAEQRLFVQLASAADRLMASHDAAVATLTALFACLHDRAFRGEM